MTLHVEGCIRDGFIFRSMPRVRHRFAGLTWAGAGTSCQGRRLNIHLSSAPAHQRIGPIMTDNPRHVLSLLPHVTERLEDALKALVLASPHGRGPASLPRRGRPPRLTASAPAHQGMY